STEGIQLRSSNEAEAVQIERAASSPTMSTVKSVTTLVIIFAFLIGMKHEVGCLRSATEEFQRPEIELRSQQWAGKTHQRTAQRIAIGGRKCRGSATSRNRCREATPGRCSSVPWAAPELRRPRRLALSGTGGRRETSEAA